MKIAILTWAINTINYGSILQAYALQEFLKDNGYDENVIIDYRVITKDLEWPNIVKIYNKKISRRIHNLFIDKKGKENGWKKRVISKCDDFKKSNLVYSKSYRGLGEIKKTVEKYDAFICGSDQVWSTQRIFNPAYYLGWVPSDKVKIAYAPSIPINAILKKHEVMLKENINGFSGVSVREEESAKKLEEILGIKVESTLDPTLLVDESKWYEMTSKSTENEKYVLCYFLGSNAKYNNCIRAIKEAYGYKVKVIPTNKNSFELGGDKQYDIGPKEFLNLIRSAEIVLTDSYHASIFSIIFKKQFALLKRFQDEKQNNQNGRIYDLTKKLKMNDVICDADNFNIQCIENIDYESIDKEWFKLREKSSDFLLGALKRG